MEQDDKNTQIHNSFSTVVTPRLHSSPTTSILTTMLLGFLLLGCDSPPTYDANAKPFKTQSVNDKKVKLPDSAVYEGNYKDGLFHGEGTLVWRNGNYYKGEFADGLMHGTGRLEYPSGMKYEGEFVDGLLEGDGRFISKQEDVYVGEFAKDNFHGKGRYEEKSGNIYEGDFLDGDFTGEGKIFYDGAEYQGGVKDWQEHGQGVYTTDEKKTVYSGTFVNGSQSGQGEIIYSDKSHYVGNIENWEPNAYGEFKSATGDHYAGMFKDGTYHGKGKLIYKTKDIYEGNFESNLRSGQGTLTLAEPKGRQKQLIGWWQNNGYLGKKKPVENAQAKDTKKNSIDAENIFYRQPDLLTDELSKLQATTPVVPDLYMINFAGYSDQDVFMKEVQYARNYFDESLGTKGRSLNLINNHKVVDEVPMASVTNLDRSIRHVAEIMDKEQDILFLFLTSHGSETHELSVTMKGLPLNDLPAEKLANIVKNSEIKWKVIVVSSCYSGGFINALKDDYTMVLTASKKDHVSFGCSDEADFTYFGRAFFKKALANSKSFAQAFKQAHVLVGEWEDQEKYDHSDPQIWTTTKIEQQLALWRKSIN